jgi:hypothetical protein
VQRLRLVLAPLALHPLPRHGKVECDSCRQHPNDAPAVTTALTDRHVKLCADCIAVDERDTRAFLASDRPLR